MEPTKSLNDMVKRYLVLKERRDKLDAEMDELKAAISAVLPRFSEFSASPECPRCTRTLITLSFASPRRSIRTNQEQFELPNVVTCNSYLTGATR